MGLCLWLAVGLFLLVETQVCEVPISLARLALVTFGRTIESRCMLAVTTLGTSVTCASLWRLVLLLGWVGSGQTSPALHWIVACNNLQTWSRL